MHPEGTRFIAGGGDNPASGAIRMPNIRSEFTRGMSWRLASRIKDFAKAESLAFHSEDEQIYARAELSRLMRSGGLAPTYRERRKDAADLDPSPAVHQGDKVVLVSIPTITDDSQNVVADTAARHRNDSRVPPIGPNRGKPRKQNASNFHPNRRSKAKDPPSVALRRDPDIPDRRTDPPVVADRDADALMRQLEQEDE